MILAARSASATKDVIIAWRFGTNPLADGYSFVFNLVGLPISVWYSIIIVCLVPVSLSVEQKDTPNHELLLDELMFWTLVAGMGVGLTFLLLFSLLFSTGASGLVGQGLESAKIFAPWLCLAIPVGFLTHYGSALLMTRGRHRNTAFEGLPALVLAVGLLCLPFGGIYTLVVGSLAGAAVHLGAISLSLKSSGRLPRIRIGTSASGWSMLISGLGAMLVTQVLLAVSGIADQFFAARMEPGSIASLGYSNRIVGLFLTLGATAIGRAVLPVFSTIDPAQPKELSRIGFRWSMIMLGGGVLSGSFVWFFSEPMVRLIFERGSFKPEDTLVVSQLLGWSAVQIPFSFAAMVTSNALFSRRRYGIAAVTAAGCLLIKLVANFLLVGPMGLTGLVLATGLFYCANFAILAFALHREGNIPASTTATER